MRKSLASAFRIEHSIGSAAFSILIQNLYLHPLAHDHLNIAIPHPLAVLILSPHIL
jgi:hypothetical protein